MLRRSRLALGTAVVLATLMGEARAQYYPGYGGYGWGGWGGGSTAQGDIARGLGYYNIGAGIYNQQTAVANSINTDTIMRWNQYLWLGQQEANKREYLRRARRQQRDSMSGDLIYKRLLENPNAHDIATGDALNVVLDQVTDPRIHSSALRMATDPLEADVVDAIPFVNASEGVTLSLQQLTAKGGWPAALAGNDYADDRAAYQSAIDQALKEDEEGQISAPTLANVSAAAARIQAKFKANMPEDPAIRVEAQNYVKALVGMAKMLERPQTEKVLAELKKVKKTSVGSLLGFMHTYNLRFGATTTPEQRTIYEKLYPSLLALRDKVVKDSGAPPAPAATARSSSRTPDFFQGMHLDDLSNKATTKTQQR